MALGPPPRKKRRPALACEQCRRRKIKYAHQPLPPSDLPGADHLLRQCRCDRLNPCQQCLKANTHDCLYIPDDREVLTTAPFEAQDTQFSVLSLFPERAPAVMDPTARTRALENTQVSDLSSSPTALPEPDDMWAGHTMTPTSWGLDLDLEMVGTMGDQSYGNDFEAASPAAIANACSAPGATQPTTAPQPTDLQRADPQRADTRLLTAAPVPKSSLERAFKPKFHRPSHWANLAYQLSHHFTP